MRFTQRKEIADKYREWVKQQIDNNQTMILDCAESVIAFLDINGYLTSDRGTWIEMGTNEDGTHNIKCSKCGEGYKTRGHARSIATKAKYSFCPNCGAKMVKGERNELRP